MPAKRRRRPVVEEIVEEPVVKEVSHKESSHDHQEHYTQTVKQVASYDEPPSEMQTEVPPPVQKEHIHHQNPEALARELLSETQNKQPKTNMKVILIITVLTALVVGFIAGGVYVYVSGVSEAVVANPTPEPTIKPSPSPSATPKPVVKLDSFSVNILNGSGIIGAASKVKNSLESAGFKVTGTGNAQNYNFKNTVIQTKEDTPSDVVSAVKEALSGYILEVGETLSASSKYDVVVTAGKN